MTAMVICVVLAETQRTVAARATFVQHLSGHLKYVHRAENRVRKRLDATKRDGNKEMDATGAVGSTWTQGNENRKGKTKGWEW